MTTGTLLVATSIAPGARIALQQSAIASWLTAGFDVVSLNAQVEIDILTHEFPGVRFRAVPRTARLLTGRDHVFIDDLLTYLVANGTDVVGIANSDIVLKPIPDLAERMAEMAAQTLISCPRLDVADPNDDSGTIDPFGFDAFFFPRAATTLWNAGRFCLGQGYWDHYLPLMAILRGFPIAKALPPIGRHIEHAISRDDSFFLFADEFAALASGYMTDSFPDEMDMTRFGQGFPKRAYAEHRSKLTTGSNEDIEAFARHIDALTRYVIRFIDANSGRIAIA